VLSIVLPWRSVRCSSPFRPAVRDAASYFFAAPMDTSRGAVWTRQQRLLGCSRSVSSRRDRSASGRPLSRRAQRHPLSLRLAGRAPAFRACLFNSAPRPARDRRVAGRYVGFACTCRRSSTCSSRVAACSAARLVRIAGFHKARTRRPRGDPTIMLNYNSRFLLAYLLTVAAFQRPSLRPISRSSTRRPR